MNFSLNWRWKVRVELKPAASATASISGYSKLKAEEVVAKSGSFKAVLGPLQEQLDRYIAEQMVEDEPIEEEEVKPIVPEVIVPGGEPQAEPEETSGNEEEIVETTEKAPVKEEQPTPEPTIPPEEKVQVQEKPKVEKPKATQAPVKEEQPAPEPTTSTEEQVPQATAKPDKPPEIYIEFE